MTCDTLFTDGQDTPCGDDIEADNATNNDPNDDNAGFEALNGQNEGTMDGHSDKNATMVFTIVKLVCGPLPQNKPYCKLMLMIAKIKVILKKCSYNKHQR